MVDTTETVVQLQRVWEEIGEENMLGRKAINDAIMYLNWLMVLQSEGRILDTD